MNNHLQRRGAAVHEERVTDYIASSMAAEPQHGGAISCGAACDLPGGIIDMPSHRVVE
jgi:hypothetical protein